MTQTFTRHSHRAPIDRSIRIHFRSIPPSFSPSSQSKSKTLVYLPGLCSTFTSNKAAYLESIADLHHLHYISLHYQGHGQDTTRSDGHLQDIETLQEFIDDALALLDHIQPPSPLLLVGSSLGALIALHIACGNSTQYAISGLVLIAPALDPWSSEYGTASHDNDADNERAGVGETKGSRGGECNDTIDANNRYIDIPSQWMPCGYIRLNKKFVTDAQKRYSIVLDNVHGDDNNSADKYIANTTAMYLKGKMSRQTPVVILHGDCDEIVPLEQVERFSRSFPNVIDCTIIKSGDHRLSSDRDLRLLKEKIELLLH